MEALLQAHLRDQHGPHGDAYGVGFLCGLQCNPERLDPNLWMNRVLWSDGDGQFENTQQARNIIGALAKQWEVTEKFLRKGQPILRPLFLTPELDMHRAYFWVAGFFDAAYFEGYDFIGIGEADQSAIAPFEVLLTAGVQRGFAGSHSDAFKKLQREDLVAILRNELLAELLQNSDKYLLRAFRHYRGLDPIHIPWIDE